MLWRTWLLPKLLRWEELFLLAAEKASRSSLNHSSLALSLLLTRRCSSCTELINPHLTANAHNWLAATKADSMHTIKSLSCSLLTLSW